MTVFVTGAANGIGRAAVEILLEEGREVIGYDVDGEGLEKLPEEVRKYEGDVADRERVGEVVEQEDFDVLVNDAGYQSLGSVEDMDIGTVREHYQTNLFGMWNVTQAALPMLREREGRVVNVSSLAGRISGPFWAAYASSKHAVEGFSDALRREVKDFGVDVVIVEPGPVKTGFNEEGRENLRNYIPESDYSDRYRELLDRGMGGVEPEKAGGVVAKAATESYPRARYTVTWQAWLGPKLACILPTRVQDWLVRRIM